MEFLNEKDFKLFFGIYIIKNIKNGKVYVGQTKQKFQKRYWHHAWKLKENSHDNKYLQNAYNKYGKDNFVFYVEKIVDKTEELDKYEIEIIEKYKNKNLCYNILSGGQGLSGYKRTEEQKRIVGEKNRINMTGKKPSKQTLEKRSLSLKGNRNGEKNWQINEEVAYKIKIMLIQNLKPKEISKSLNIGYKIVNAILSNNAWHRVYVDGWDDFRKNRKTYNKLSKKDYEKIYKMHTEDNISIIEIANLYGKTRGAIYKGIKKFEEKIKK